MADMTYSDSAASIQQNQWFRSRVQVSTSKYANYLLNTPTDDEDYAARVSAGTRLASQYSQIVDQLMFTLSGDTEVIAAGPAIPDVTLQPLVEKTINKLYPANATPAGFHHLQAPQAPNWSSTPPPTKQ
jgi:hypothetical protein